MGVEMRINKKVFISGVNWIKVWIWEQVNSIFIITTFHFIKWKKNIFKHQCDRFHKELNRNVRTNANKYDHQQSDLKVSAPPPKGQ